MRFLSGIQDGVRFDSVEGDAALERLLAASEPEFEAISSLPPIDFESSDPVPTEGRLERFHAAQLMRYCESNSLTCALELEVDGKVLTARYRLGELLSVEPDSEHTARLAEAKEGIYRFRLPRFELPPNVLQRRSAPPSAAKVAASRPAPASAGRIPVASPSDAPLGSPRSGAVAPGVTPAMPAAAARAPSAPVSARSAPAAPSGSSARAPASAPSKVAAAAPTSARAPSDVRPVAAPIRNVTIGGVAAPANPPPGAVRRDARSGGTLIGGTHAAARPHEPPPPSAHGAPAAAPTPAAPPAAPAQPSATAPSAGAQRSPLPPSSSGAPRSPAPAPTSSPAPAQLEGLWKDAVKPPPQSAPLELEAGAQGSLAPSSAKPRVPRREEAATSSKRQRGSGKYWLIALLLILMLAVAGWLLFGR